MKGMRFEQNGIPGSWVIEPATHSDDRGRFFRAWCSKEFSDRGIDFLPAQANMGYNLRKGTVRGMHVQVVSAREANPVRGTRGGMLDVVLDLRPDSQTYGKCFGVELTGENAKMLFLPELCAHGYQTLEDNTEMHYMASQVYIP